MNRHWYEAALCAIHNLAQSGRGFTTDDVWDALAALATFTTEPRALGAIMRDAARAGTIQPTVNFVKSRRPVCHSRPVRVWVGAAARR